MVKGTVNFILTLTIQNLVHNKQYCNNLEAMQNLKAYQVIYIQFKSENHSSDPKMCFLVWCISSFVEKNIP